MKKTLLIILILLTSYNSFSQLYIGAGIHQANSIAIDNSYGSWDWGFDVEYKFKKYITKVGFWPLVRTLNVTTTDPVALYQIPFMIYSPERMVYCEGLPSRKINFGSGIYLVIPLFETGLDRAVFYGITNEISFSFYFSDNTEGRIGLITNFDLGLGRAESGVFMRFSMPSKDFWNRIKSYKL